MTCLFCQIIEKKIPADIVFENEEILAFKDISPQAPTHILVIPKKHLSNVLEFNENDAKLLTRLFSSIQEIVSQHNLTEDGFRIVTNTGEKSGQTVFHLHFHLLAGRDFNWPPG